jgi:hypothetical protein
MAITANPSVQVGALSVGNGTRSFLNITATTLVKATAGRVAKVSVIVAGSGAGSVYDAATLGAAGSTNEIAVVPNTAGVYTIDFPCANGIVVSPGTGQTLAISFN